MDKLPHHHPNTFLPEPHDNPGRYELDGLNDERLAVTYAIGARGVVHYVDRNIHTQGTDILQYRSEEIEAYDEMEQKHFGAVLPTFEEQLHDKTRTNLIEYYAPPINERTPYTEMWSNRGDIRAISEHDALKQLHEFFDFFEQRSTDPAILARMNDADRQDLAHSREEFERLRGSISFLGEQERINAETMLADRYALYLRLNPTADVVLYAGVGADKDSRKSDTMIRNEIHALIASKDEYADIASRVYTDLDVYAKAKPNGKAKIVVLDDWSISGHQMAASAQKAADSARYYGIESSVEVNLLAARKSQLENGVTLRRETESVPVYAGYVTPEDTWHITGAHSTVDYGFQGVIERIAESLRGRSSLAYNKIDYPDIALTRVAPPYRYDASGNVPKQ